MSSQPHITPSALLDQVWPVHVRAGLQAPVPVRPDQFIPQGFPLSRKEVRRRIKYAIPLRRPAGAGFAYQRGRRRRV